MSPELLVCTCTPTMRGAGRRCEGCDRDDLAHVGPIPHPPSDFPAGPWEARDSRVLDADGNELFVVRNVSRWHHDLAATWLVEVVNRALDPAPVSPGEAAPTESDLDDERTIDDEFGNEWSLCARPGLWAGDRPARQGAVLVRQQGRDAVRVSGSRDLRGGPARHPANREEYPVSVQNWQAWIALLPCERCGWLPEDCPCRAGVRASAPPKREPAPTEALPVLTLEERCRADAGEGGGMRGFAVTAERLIVHPHPNADRLELAQVGLCRAVVAKGSYRSGDFGVYIPESAIVPDDLLDELGLTGKLAGHAKNRVKAVRLRGEISQGIVCRPRSLLDLDYETAANERWDLADKLGIHKWVPPIPPQMSGQAVSGADLLRWIDIENLQRYPDIFTPGEPVAATEKLHGTCMVLTCTRAEILVSSKGLASNGIALAESATNLYWRAASQYGLPELADQIRADLDAERVAIYGEVYGAGVQDLHYGADTRADRIGYAAFDIRVDAIGDGPRWMGADNVAYLCHHWGIPMVPELYRGPFDLDKLREVTSGLTVHGGGAHIREGIVIRPVMEAYSDVVGGRKIAKLISPDYLTRSGDTTEFE